ncbi:CRISPR-associated endonuclease Cas1 [Sphingomonas quercus]|uniref:Uncharacterized protein n=1 Tax=Sphingomonas quercus TaxID=2842451 RepID=A0ABS6BMH9_9SPHN|nr:CRISPR-associated endonuclease Cas1 [Sphingomonas quercus]MBU3079528.1 hypothetical protein [Sphingomonas quercus]
MLRHRDERLVIVQSDAETTLALAEIAWLIIDTPQASISDALVAALAEHGVMMIVADAGHHPVGVLSPPVRAVRTTIGEQLWVGLSQALATARMRNQANLLRQLREPLHDARVRRSAPSLFSTFAHGMLSDRRGALLRYGEAVARAALIRACAAAGLVIAAREDRVDALLGPVRPFLDRAAHRQSLGGIGTSLSLDDRQRMAAPLGEVAMIGDRRMPLLAAIGAMTMSIARAARQGDAALVAIPSLPPVTA